ncbi:MAG: zinc ribbon domain-containing protein [Bacteriovoracia bacterium]
MTQSLPLKEQLKALEQLQEIDLKIDQLQAKKTSLPAQLKVLENTLALSKKTLEKKTFDLREVEKQLKQTRAAMQLNQERMDRAGSRIADVNNTKEFGAANKEVDQLTKLNAELDTQRQKIEADLATAQKGVDDATASHDELQKKWEAESATVTGQVSGLDGDIGKLMGDRKQFTPGIRSDILSRYDRVRKAKNGMGIAPAIAGRCKGCNMMINPQMYNEMHKGLEVHACHTCHRILYLAG